MKQEHKEQWISILNESKIPAENHEKLLEYIDTHMSNEIKVLEHTPVENQKESTLPEALKTLKEIGDLSRIHFVSQPVGGDKKKKTTWATTNHVIKLRFDNINDYIPIPNIELQHTRIFVEQTVTELKKLLESKDLYIYMLYSTIDVNEHIVTINHRFQAK